MKMNSVNSLSAHHPSGTSSTMNGRGEFNSSSSEVPPHSLKDDNLMIMSQSIDSIHTIGDNGSSDISDVRTLFVSGLPMDARSRELYLLFRSFQGYMSSTLKPAGKNGKPTAPVGFVTFESREQADHAMSTLQGVKFDPEGTQQIRLEFARSNTKVTKPKAPVPPQVQTPAASAALNPSFFHPFSGFDQPLIAHDHPWHQIPYDLTGLLPSNAIQPAALLSATHYRALLPPGTASNLHLAHAVAAASGQQLGGTPTPVSSGNSANALANVITSSSQSTGSSFHTGPSGAGLGQPHPHIHLPAGNPNHAGIQAFPTALHVANIHNYSLLKDLTNPSYNF